MCVDALDAQDVLKLDVQHVGQVLVDQFSREFLVSSIILSPFHLPLTPVVVCGVEGLVRCIAAYRRLQLRLVVVYNNAFFSGTVY